MISRRTILAWLWLSPVVAVNAVALDQIGLGPRFIGDLSGVTTVRHPLLLEAVLRFQRKSTEELLPQ